MQGIEFQIVNDSAEASRGLDELAKSLANLKNSLGSGGSSMSRLAKNITSIKTAVPGLNTSKITELGNALNAFGNATASLSISSSIGNQIQKLATAVNSIPDSTSQKLGDLATSLKPLTELGKQQIGSFITQLQKIPNLVTELGTVDMSKFKQQMEDLANAMKPLANEMQKVSSGFSAFPSRIQKLVTSTQQYNSAVQKAVSGSSNWGKALKTVSLAAVFKGATSFLGKAIDKANEYIESLNLFTVSMGDYAEQAYNYAQQVGETMGIDPGAWMKEQGVFNSIISGFGVAEDKAYTMSKNLTQLAYDISSFYNIGIEESMQKVQSGISGELEPLRRLGYDLSVARLQQEAYNLGINESVSNMTQAEKAQLRYYAMLTQVTQVQGDMARTLDQPANQLRVLKMQVELATRSFGNLFIPILNKVLPLAIAVASAIREIINAIAALFGIQMADEVDWSNGITTAAGATEEIADNVDDAAGSAKKLKSYLMGFDELNVIDPNSGSSGSSSATAGGAGFDLDPIDYDFLGGAVTDRVDAMKAKLEPFVTWIENHLKEILIAAGLVGTAFLGWKIGGELIGGVKVVSMALEGIKGKLNTVWQLAGWITSRFTGMNVPLTKAAASAGKFAALGAAIAVIVARFIDLYKNSEAFRTGLERIGEIGGAIFGGIKTVIGDVVENLKEFAAWLLDLVPDSVKKKILGFFEEMQKWLGTIDLDWKDLAITIAGIAALFVPGGQLVGAALLGFETISVMIRTLGTVSDEQFTAMLEKAKSVFSGIWEFIKGVLNGIITFLTGVFIGNWQMAFDGMKGVAQSAFDFIGTLSETLFRVNIANVVRDVFENHVKPFFSFETWAEMFNGVKEAIVQKIKDAINGGIALFNTFIAWVNEKMRFSWDAVTIMGQVVVPAGSAQLFTIPKIPMMAEGGFPDMGQMFIAREAGPELVGSIGNRTAVANNDQIVEAVSGGVREANDEQNRLLREQNELLRAILAKDTGVKLDGKTLLRSTEKAARQRGTVIIAGGVTG